LGKFVVGLVNQRTFSDAPLLYPILTLGKFALSYIRHWVNLYKPFVVT